MPAQLHEQFEAAWSTAAELLGEAPQCLYHEIARGFEEPDNYVVRIEWTSVHDHEQGFRRSPSFDPVFTAVKPFVERIEEMRHYEATTIRSNRQ